MSDIWIVDSGTDKVYLYTGATTRTSGSQLTAVTFILSAGNTNPQGIADPPPTELVDAVLTEGMSDDDLVMDVVPATLPSDGDHDAALFSIMAEFEQAWVRPKRKTAILLA